MYIGDRKELNTYESKSRWGTDCVKKRIKTLLIFHCDVCGIQFEREKGICWGRDNNDHKHFCSKCSSPVVSGAIGRKKISEIWKKKIGEKQIDSCGYMTVYVANTHPYSNGYCGRQREHILVMENHLERSLQKGEVVHHIDGDKLNNEIENLDLCTVGQHNACHATSERIIFELYKRDLVGYNRESKRYYLK